MITYLSPFPRTTHSGGVRKLFDHVDILRRHGYPADAVVTEGNWKVPAGTELLMVPEVYGDLLRTLPEGIPRVSVNQNAFFTWGHVNSPTHPYLNTPELRCVWTVSEQNYRLLRWAFPGIRLERFWVSTDERFKPGPYPRPRVISFFGRRRMEQAALVASIISSRGKMQGWQMIPLDGMGDAQVAETMANSAIFLSLSQREGLPAPPREALASGCIVVGFTGLGGEELLPIAGRAWLPVEEEDSLRFAYQLERAMDMHRDQAMLMACREAAVAIRQVYSREREEESVITLTRQALGVPV